MSVQLKPILALIMVWLVITPPLARAQNSPASNEPSTCSSILDQVAKDKCVVCLTTGGIFSTHQSGDVFDPNKDWYGCRYGINSGDSLSEVCASIPDPNNSAICSSCLAAGKDYNYDKNGQSWCSLSSAEKPKLKDFDFCGQIGDERLRDACENCGESGDAIFTAFGCVSTDQEGLSRDLITVLFGIAGGVALLSILAASFLLSTSQGDTNKIKTAKGYITASVSGLLFMIFSIIVLKFIGVDILKIPGLI